MLRAYLSGLAVDPGDSLGLHVAAPAGATLRVDEHRHSDPHPDGPGRHVHTQSWGGGRLAPCAPPTSLGSFGVAERALPVGGSATLSVWVWPTDLDEPVTLLSWQGEHAPWELVLARSGLTLRGNGEEYAFAHRIRERAWSFVGVAWGAARFLRPAGATLFAAMWGRTGGPFSHALDGASPSAGAADLRVGAGASGDGRLDGRVAGLRVHADPLDAVELMNVMNGVGPPAFAEWDLGGLDDPDLAPASRGEAGPLRLVHAPTRSTSVPPAVESSGRPLTAAGSVHFHRDDTEDCGWPAGARIEVPQDARPGLYAAHLEGDETHDLPFVVRGAGEVCLLVPTLTWQAYSNLGRDSSWPGPSQYARHTDDSPVMITTARRPTPTFAPDARLEVEAGDGFAEGGVATHLMQADLYAWWWLSQEFPDHAGVLDDRELHHRGADALAGVKVLVLSAHPEYWTAAMLDALHGYLTQGGGVVYLGGNGLYWVTSLHPTKPHLMEVRRWGGSQTWSVDEHDRRHQFEQCQGGLWAEAGRPPNDSVGVGFTGFGSGPSLEYVRTAASYEPQWSWLFDGVDGAVVGARGLNGGAGNEFDSFDPARSPRGESVVVATASPDTPDHFGSFEQQGHRAPSPGVRSDLVLTRTAAGSFVLAFGSITASGCLVSRTDTGVATITRNAVRRMLSSP